MSVEINEEFYKKIMQIVDTANKKQTQDLKREIDEIKEAVAEESRKLTELENKLEELQKKNQKLEKALIKNNAVIFGVSAVEEENILEKVITLFNSQLDTTLTPQDINDIYTIGKQEEKPIIIKFVSYMKKVEVIKKSYKFKNYNKINNSKIYITHELTPEEQETQKILRNHMKQARNKGLTAYIRKGKLIVGEESYTVQQIRDLNSNLAKEGQTREKGDKHIKSKLDIEKDSKTEESEEESLNQAKKLKTAENRPRLLSGGRNRKPTKVI